MCWSGLVCAHRHGRLRTRTAAVAITVYRIEEFGGCKELCFGHVGYGELIERNGWMDDGLADTSKEHIENELC